MGVLSFPRKILVIVTTILGFNITSALAIDDIFKCELLLDPTLKQKTLEAYSRNEQYRSKFGLPPRKPNLVQREIVGEEIDDRKRMAQIDLLVPMQDIIERMTRALSTIHPRSTPKEFEEEVSDAANYAANILATGWADTLHLLIVNGQDLEFGIDLDPQTFAPLRSTDTEHWNELSKNYRDSLHDALPEHDIEPIISSFNQALSNHIKSAGVLELPNRRQLQWRNGAINLRYRQITIGP